MDGLSRNAAPLLDGEGWTFVGVPKWKQDHEGQIYPPVWSYPNFDPDPTRAPSSYAHELAREDYAFLTSTVLGDTDVSVDYKCPYGAVVHGGIVFRAVDSARCYVLDVTDMGRKGQHYELVLWLQDETGYRKELARGRAPHSIVPERIVQAGPKTRADWNISSPDWVTVRVQASGSDIRVSMDGSIVLETRDRTWPAGCIGLVGRGAAYFRDLRVSGVPAELPAPWSTHEGELPRFFYPGGTQDEAFNAYPVACRTRDGVVLVAWSHAAGAQTARLLREKSVVLARSQDEGRTWSRPTRMLGREGHACTPRSMFEHRDGTISCLAGARPSSEEGRVGEPKTMVTRSSDAGATWSEPEEFLVAGRPIDRFVHPYSPMQTLSDGTVVFCGYEARTIIGGNPGINAERLDRALFFRSDDDGVTWEEPIYFDSNNFDHNECMVAEVGPGKLVAFMRTLAAPCMWTSRSDDFGRSWTPLKQSDVSATCPYLLRHSSGALILASRGLGTFLKLSYDCGRSWTQTVRMSPASAMMGMAEMADGRVLNVMHEGYRVPGYVRGQFFHVTPDGPVAAD